MRQTSDADLAFMNGEYERLLDENANLAKQLRESQECMRRITQRNNELRGKVLRGKVLRLIHKISKWSMYLINSKRHYRRETMKLDDLLSVTSCVINVKYEDYYINSVTPNNPMISKSIFNMNVVDIKPVEDKYGNGMLEVEIEEC